MTTKLKKGDSVIVITGKDKGKEGKVLLIDRKNNRVVVEGINIISKHQKPNAHNQQGGIIKREAAIHASNVMYSLKGKAVRLGVKVVDGEKKRFAKSTGELID